MRIKDPKKRQWAYRKRDICKFYRPRPGYCTTKKTLSCLTCIGYKNKFEEEGGNIK